MAAMDNEHSEEHLISVPAAYFWNSTLEVMKFEVAVARTKRLMSKVQLELLRTIISLSPEISKQLSENPTFIELKPLPWVREPLTYSSTTTP
jgi:hypothetical protein